MLRIPCQVLGSELGLLGFLVVLFHHYYLAARAEFRDGLPQSG
jgi:hypothetical protein